MFFIIFNIVDFFFFKFKFQEVFYWIEDLLIMVLVSCCGGCEYKDGIILLFIYCYLVRFSVFDKKIKKKVIFKDGIWKY